MVDHSKLANSVTVYGYPQTENKLHQDTRFLQVFALLHKLPYLNTSASSHCTHIINADDVVSLL